MKIASVIVTYNRKECLTKLIDVYDRLKFKPDTIIIVNNNSTDGTYDMLKSWEIKNTCYDKYVLNLDKNIGGSGGFFEGIKKALEIGAEWIYLSDDDAYPDNEIFNIFRMYINNNNMEKIASLCSSVIKNGAIDLGHRKRIVKGRFFIKEVKIKEEEYYQDTFYIDLFTYVGTLINSDFINLCGLPEKDYFIYYDDTEHSIRLSKKGEILCIPSAKVNHDISEIVDNAKLSWKTYYGIRNKLITIKKHYGMKYFLIEYILRKIQVYLKFISGNIEDSKLRNQSLKDAKIDKLGIHDKYKPGWKP